MSHQSPRSEKFRSPFFTRAVLLAGLLICGLLLIGCGGQRTLNVEFKKGDPPAKGSAVYLEGRRVGEVQRVREETGGFTATVRFAEDARLRDLKPGIMPYMEEGRIRIDASRIQPDADPLPAGATVAGYDRPTVIFKRYGLFQTIVAAVAGSVVVFAIGFVFKSIFRMGVVTFSLLASVALAFMFHNAATPLAERLCTAIAPPAETATRTKEPSAPPPGQEESPAGGEAETSVPTVEPGVTRVQEIVHTLSAPNPRIISFFGVWLISFVGIQFILGYALRATRSK